METSCTFDSMSERAERSLGPAPASDENKRPVGRVVIYEDAPGDARMEVWLSDGSMWFSQQQIAELFDRDRALVTKHLNFAYRDGELDPETTRARFAELREEGGRAVTRGVLHYNLDAILAVGFRIRSRPGARFRSWATKLLKDHLLRGYTTNPERLLEVGTEDAHFSLGRLDRTIARRRAARADR